MNIIETFSTVMTLTIPNACVDLAYMWMVTLGVVYISRWLDKRSGQKWSAVYAKMLEEPLAISRYAGCRIIALAILGAAVILRG